VAKTPLSETQSQPPQQPPDPEALRLVLELLLELWAESASVGSEASERGWGGDPPLRDPTGYRTRWES